MFFFEISCLHVQVVEDSVGSTAPEELAALCAYQHFENIRNFLVAVQDLGIPTFEPSDLQQAYYIFFFYAYVLNFLKIILLVWVCQPISLITYFQGNSQCANVVSSTSEQFWALGSWYSCLVLNTI
jgi:hypothetical protein